MSKLYSCPQERKIVQKIASDLGTTKEQVFQIIDFQRQTLKETMAKGDFEGFRMAYIGKFVVNIKRLKALNNRNYYELIHGKRGNDNNSSGSTEDQ
jgi:hypothetical protein